jgi:hypothetical protein
MEEDGNNRLGRILCRRRKEHEVKLNRRNEEVWKDR